MENLTCLSFVKISQIFYIINNNLLQLNKLYDKELLGARGKKQVCFLPLATNKGPLIIN